ncbi:HD superfamily hydrolase, putative [Cordyceps militaris CM01]|uniref:HD superfamily hydrolase, putative n=2 Tax=Cordyceps militaris TaxID=73501 RepID=G3JC18_CORMM|nr:HD superfamily hydrolase, putative [Cordyceps militaris CM01]ATY61288.1 HD domain [Cordyceps militaris]EGX93736.1 HD superfamily hydrolase, putative [Cordyceps militaris CM01]
MASFEVDEALIARVTDFVQEYMSHYDASHDFTHIQRVLRLAQHIQARTPNTSRALVTLAALLHDVGDHKYLAAGADGTQLVAATLRSLGAAPALADKVQAVCLGVSYSAEVRDGPARMAALLAAHPELAVVQDADRLDALGMVGAGRTFAFGAARGRPLEDTVAHFEDKLLLLEGRMKTDTGRALARERTQRLRMMQQWWLEETGDEVR